MVYKKFKSVSSVLFHLQQKPLIEDSEGLKVYIRDWLWAKNSFMIWCNSYINRVLFAFWERHIRLSLISYIITYMYVCISLYSLPFLRVLRVFQNLYKQISQNHPEIPFLGGHWPLYDGTYSLKWVPNHQSLSWST